MAFNINRKVFNIYAVATAAVLTIAACGGGGGTSSSAGGASGGATVAGVVDNGGVASLDIWNRGNTTTGEKLFASLAQWVSKPALAAPVVGASVQLTCGGDGGFDETTVTDENGQFVFTGVPAASCNILVNNIPASQFDTANGAVININITVEPGEAAADSTVTVRGRVDDGDDGNANGNDNVAGDDDSSSEDSVSTASSDDDSSSEDSTSAANNDNTDPGTGNDNTANDNTANDNTANDNGGSQPA